MLVLGIAVAAVLIAVGLWPWGQLVAGVVVVVSAAKAREQYSTPAFYLIVCAGLYFTIMGAISSYTWLTDHGL